MTSRYSSGAGPGTSHDGKVFQQVLCFVGRDLEYGVAAISILLAKGIRVAAIVGEAANSIGASCNFPVDYPSVKILAVKRPWESPLFKELINTGVLGVNGGFEYIIPGTVLDILPIINIHPAVLPYNRGCHHSFWGIMDKTPLGASLHWMTRGIDDGPIICQKTFTDDGRMTAEEIQKRSNELCLALLHENIEAIVNGRTQSTPQGAGSYHSKSDIVEASTLDASQEISVSYLFDLCRATNNKKNGFLIRKDGRRFRIIIDKVEELLPSSEKVSGKNRR